MQAGDSAGRNMGKTPTNPPEKPDASAAERESGAADPMQHPAFVKVVDHFLRTHRAEPREPNGEPASRETAATSKRLDGRTDDS